MSFKTRVSMRKQKQICMQNTHKKKKKTKYYTLSGLEIFNHLLDKIHKFRAGSTTFFKLVDRVSTTA